MNEDMAKGIDLTEGIEGKLHTEFEDAKAKVKKADTLVEYYHKPTFRIVINAIKVLFPVLGDLFDDNLCTMLEDNQLTRNVFRARHRKRPAFASQPEKYFL